MTHASRLRSAPVVANRGSGLAYRGSGLAYRGRVFACRGAGLAYPRRGLVVPLLALLCLASLVGCASDRKDGPPVVRTKIDYDSTRDGPRPQVVDDGLPAAKPDPSECDHIWEAVPRGTHAYPDPSDPLGMAVAICTPVVCTKCGLVRHECQKRTKKRR